jgi:3'-phosphoadenosine 5'-phosphosulfate sulfotransferase (PAPS reductase)/FAD synthetase
MSYTIDELLKATDNEIIKNTFVTAQSVCNMYNNIMVSISGGSDSDIMMDIMCKVDKDHKCHYVFFDTGIEYQATKDHIDYLESKYDVIIERIRPIEPVGVAVRKYGQPLVSKYVSGQINALQSINFEWEDDSLENLIEKYGDSHIGALKWWCGEYSKKYSIDSKLKEYIQMNPPTFQVSNKCCTCAKKQPSKDLVKERGFDCVVIGVRKSEGGIRSLKYNTCLDEGNYRPLLEWTDGDKIEYETAFGIEHSKCYTEYGFKRTGCAGCPYGGRKTIQNQKLIIMKKEPKLYTAISNIFKDAIEWQNGYYHWLEGKKYEWFKNR